jgi:hypothetical protein
VIIYAFEHLPTGRCYVGHHKADPLGWPAQGVGRLPDGYGGSGKVWRRVARRHPPETFAWRILARADTLEELYDLERRWIAMFREALGRRLCLNRAERGGGWTSEEARVYVRRGLETMKANGWAAQRANGRRTNKLYADKLAEWGRLTGGRKALAAAVRRRDRGERPLLGDFRLLAETGEAPNPIEPREPREPRAGNARALALAKLRRGPATAAELAGRLGWPEARARGAIDRLRSMGWPIVVDEEGRFRLSSIG